jgi:DNA mismatch repair protein MutL
LRSSSRWRLPALLSRRRQRELLRAAAAHLASQGNSPGREQLAADLLALPACHAAVRAGARRTAGEVEALLARRHLARDSHHCPHGRPTSARFGRRELEKVFRRV